MTKSSTSTEVCTVCDKPDYLVTYHGELMHQACAPLPWRKDREKHESFMGSVRDWWYATGQYQRRFRR